MRIVQKVEMLLTEHLPQIEPGGGLVMSMLSTSPDAPRMRLIAWAVNQHLGTGASDARPRVLYVGESYQQLKSALLIMRKMREEYCGKAGYHFTMSREAVQAQFSEFTYVTLDTVLRLGNTFPTRFDLLVLDERHEGRMGELAKFAAYVRPVTTLVFTIRRLPDDHPWQHFTGPLVVGRGPRS